MALDILKFLSEADPDHPSIEADSWYEAVATALEEQYPEVLKPIQAQIQRMSDTLWESEDLFKYDWSAFEDLIGILYRKQGYAVEVTQDVADMGVDVWARKEDERVAIQVKHFQEGNTVGRETLQKIGSTLAKGDADQAVVVTSSAFADTAEQYARDFPDLKLIDHDELIRRLSEAGIPPPA